MTDALVPMPGTCHPHYAEQAVAIRNGLHLGHVTVVETPRLHAFYAEPGDLSVYASPFPTRVLTVKKVAAPAPYVGDPMFAHRMYYWYAAVDDLGRHVAGDATLSERITRFD